MANFPLKVENTTPAPVVGWDEVYEKGAEDLAARGYEVTGEMREQQNCTPVRFARWEKRHFSNHKKPWFVLPKLGDLVSVSHLPKGKNLLLGVKPLGAPGSEATMWMCPCGWLTPVSDR